jgi:hypothetical protein
MTTISQRLELRQAINGFLIQFQYETGHQQTELQQVSIESIRLIRRPEI